MTHVLRCLLWTAALLSVILLSTGSAAAQTPTVVTDKPDYLPGEMVVVTGTGWQPGETVALEFVETPLVHPAETLYAAANSAGEILNAEYLIQQHDLGQMFTLTAIGQSSGWIAETQFTDASPGTFGNYATAGLSGTPAFVGPIGVATNVTFSNLVRGGGLNPASASNGFNSSSWQTSSSLTIPGNTDYYEFTVSPASCYTFSMSELRVGLQRSGSGPDKVELRSDVDSYGSTIGSVLTVSMTVATFTINLGSVTGLQNRTSPVTFRIYGYNANSVSGTLRIQNVASPLMIGLEVDGTVAPITVGAAGLITGLNSVCSGATSVAYSIDAVSGATTYNWTVPSGATVASGQGTTSVTVDWGSTSGNVSVTPSNSCFTGTASNIAFTVGIAPALTCPLSITVNNDPGVCGAIVTFSATATGSPSPAVTCSPTSGSLFPVGTTTVTATATNSCGTQSCTFIVNVIDNTPPVPNIATLPAVTGQCSATIASPPTATDNCAGSIIGTTSDPLSYSTQGTFTVTWSYNDGNGNTSTQTQTVIVNDTQAPVPNIATLPGVTGQCSATIAAPPTATDNCTGSIIGTTSDPSSYSTQGTFTITWSYDDGNGNTSIQTQTVTVQDVTPPSIVCPANIIAAVPAGGVSMPVTFTVTGSDNCSPPTTLTSPASGSLLPVGITPVYATATDIGSNTANCSFSVTVKSTPMVTVATPAAVQYSDNVTLSAIVSATPFPGYTLNGTVQFSIAGNAVGSPQAIPAGGGTVSITIPVTLEPNTYDVTAQFNSSNTNYYTDASGGPATLTVNREDAIATFTGPEFVSTSSPTSCSVTLTLSATIKDITAVLGDPAYDANGGDIRKAKIRFVNTGSYRFNILASVGLVDPSDPLTGTATATYQLTLNSGDCSNGGTSIAVTAFVENYYVNAPSSVALATSDITVSVPGKDFVSGGGFLVMSNSAGQIRGKNGSKTNFGWTMKYNKSGRNLQGQANIIIRADDNKMYHVKSNAINSMTVNGTRGNFSTKANLTDISDPLTPIPLGGNLTLLVDMNDLSTGGQDDLVGISLQDNAGGLLYSSNWNGTTSVLQLLRQPTGGGNVRVLSTAIAKTNGEVEPFIPVEYALYQNYPNPFNPSTQIMFDLPEDSKVSVTIYDVLGQAVISLVNEERAAGRFEETWQGTNAVGVLASSGMYFVRIEAKSLASTRSLVAVRKMLMIK